MSEGDGEPVKNGDAEVSPAVQDLTTEPTVECPDVDFSPYDEHGRPKPFVCICPPCPQPNPGQEPTCETTNGTDKEDPPSTEAQTKEETKDEKPPSSPAPSSPAPSSPAPSSPVPPPSEAPGSPSSSDAKTLSKSFSEQFKLFSKFGDIKSDGRLLSLSQSDKWMKQAKVIDGKHITTTDTGIHFKKLKSIKVSETDYKKFLEDLAKTKKMNCEDIKKKMVACGTPGLTSLAAGAKAPSAFDRLTDTSKYTGSHKQRFDELGKGRGIAGRKDIHDNSGYVSGYMNKNTYDRKNPTK